MDLLGSILDSMEKPPPVNTKEKEMLKKQKELAEKMRAQEKAELSRFRKYVEDRVDRFSKDDRKYIEFETMDKIYRGIIHEVAEVAKLVAMSFGREGVDRYTIIYKKEHLPSEDEIAARRLGEEWNAEKAEEYAKKREEQKQKVTTEKEQESTSTSEVVPNSNYKDKYAHLIGQEAALEAARKTESNKNYGIVPSKNKKDLRSIEQTMADIQARKRLKTQQDA
ncbi:unnamed protein product [Hermetia illucens]|uniref:R3H domain-containing protein n=1 Tax=Hermetia illucens TaxID=343691 RepID=A0A7R8UWM5_HERIL|nr:sperm-associated antigen 7 homolog [Hermetia illucens]CAD7087278.1 unnamed protein product [Hermetia illucens]